RTPTRTRSCARGHHRQARLAGLGADQAGAAQRMPVHHHLPPRRAGPSLRRRRQAHPHDGLPRAEKTMTPVLRSYSQSTWQDGTGPIRPLADAATGETVALLPTTGPDPGAMLAHAREVGGPALRALTFTQRAAILKDLAKHLRGHVEEFAELSARTGATRRDTAVDGDGGAATLAAYASNAARAPPDATPLPRGPPEPLAPGRLREQGRPSPAGRPPPARRRRRTPRPWRHLRRTPRPRAPAGRRRSDQRVQLSRVGHAGEVRARVPGRDAVGGQARRPDRLSHRTRGAPHHRIRNSPRGDAVAAMRRSRRSSRRPHAAGHPELHRFGHYRARVAHPPGRRGTLGALQRRG